MLSFLFQKICIQKESVYNWLIRCLFDFSNSQRVHLPVKHILFINWNGKIGDAVISSFLYRELRRAYPGIIISVVTTEELETLYLKYYGVDHVHIVRRCSLWELYQLTRYIKNVDTVVPLIGLLDLRHLFFLWRLHPRNVFGLDDSLCMNNGIFYKQAQGLIIHDIFREILQQIGISEFNDQYIIPSRQEPFSRPVWDIVFNPFGSRQDKSLAFAKAVSLLQMIGQEYPSLRIGLMYSPSTLNAAMEIENAVQKTNITVIPNTRTFFDAMDDIRNAAVVISVDTALVHIAAGLKKKTIAFYYRPENEFNCWLPRRDAKVKLIYSDGPAKYRLKDMNRFENSSVLNAIHVIMKQERDRSDSR